MACYILTFDQIIKQLLSGSGLQRSNLPPTETAGKLGYKRALSAEKIEDIIDIKNRTVKPIQSKLHLMSKFEDMHDQAKNDIAIRRFSIKLVKF